MFTLTGLILSFILAGMFPVDTAPNPSPTYETHETPTQTDKPSITNN